MRLTLTHILLTLLAICALAACSQKTTSAPEKAPAAAPAATPTAPAENAKPAGEDKEPAAQANSAPKAQAAANPSIDSKTNVVPPAENGEGMDNDAKAKLAKVYTEIYCAQRRGESEKLLDIYTKNGFDDPEAWTKTWTKAAEDGAWVAKTTHDAIRQCGDQSPPTQ